MDWKYRQVEDGEWDVLEHLVGVGWGNCGSGCEVLEVRVMNVQALVMEVQGPGCKPLLKTGMGTRGGPITCYAAENPRLAHPAGR